MSRAAGPSAAPLLPAGLPWPSSRPAAAPPPSSPSGGGAAALRKQASADAAEEHWPDAAGRFEAAAHAAELTRDASVADLWAQAGNAWLAAGQPVKARTDLDAALTAGTLTGQPLGEAQLDHARALVAGGDLDHARTDLDLALANAPADPLAWLLSATLARRQNDLARAKTDIAQALARSADDAQVQLEAGNIAAMGGDEAAARTAWGNAARIAPDKPAGRSAVAALAQFGAPAPAIARSPSTKAGPTR